MNVLNFAKTDLKFLGPNASSHGILKLGLLFEVAEIAMPAPQQLQ